LTNSYSSVANNLRDFLHSQGSSSPAAWAFVGSDVKAVCLRHFYQVRGADRARGDADGEKETSGQVGVLVRQKSKQRARIGLSAMSFGCIENV
jgi:hypothetical protein